MEPSGRIQLGRAAHSCSTSISTSTSSNHFNWDADGVIITALQLSRVVRDNGYSPEFAARIVEREDGQKQVISQGQHYFSFLPTYRSATIATGSPSPKRRELRLSSTPTGRT